MNRSFNILVADDDTSVCLVLSTLLGRLGHHVEIVYDGKEAIMLLATKPGHFDILITDHRMPLVSGLELVHHLRKNEFAGKIMVISGFLTDDLLCAYRDKRVDKIIQKPFSVEELSSTLKDTLEQWSESASLSPIK